MHYRARVNLGLLLFIAVLSSACVTSPTRQLSSYAASQGFTEEVLASERFLHRIFSRSSDQSPDTHLNVYLEGDGIPWIARYYSTNDPTPRHPLMLRLMARDTANALYLGRPCYNGFSRSAACSKDLWTAARYSPIVVESLAQVLRSVINRQGIESVSLFGHSGGGTLAVLLASQIPQTDAVVTLAGNLNVQGWIAHHGYSPLYSSLDPVNQPPLKRAIRQYHFLGATDTNIPPDLTAPWVSQQVGAQGFIVDDADHSCCWLALWPRILNGVKRAANPAVQARPLEFPGRSITRIAKLQ